MNIGDWLKTTTGILVAFSLIVLVALVMMFTTGSIQRWTADWRGKTSQIEKTHADANYRIANYDAFFNDCAAAQTMQQNLANTKTALRQARHDGNTSEVTRQETNLQAQSNELNDLVNSYNADTAKVQTKAYLRDSSLPITISAKEKITCSH